MRILLISDIHSNIVALDAVIAHASHGSGYSAVWALGDIVGYGPSPNECIERLASIGAVMISGNHDVVCSGNAGVDTLSGPAGPAAAWTRAHLTPTSITALASLPSTRIEGDFTLVHGSPKDPEREYLLTAEQAAASLPLLVTRHCLMGHSHRQLLFRFNDSGAEVPSGFVADADIQLGDDRVFINPGSVGQSRDGDWRAAYAILDTAADTISFHRCEYDRAVVAGSMRRAGLPGVLINRMMTGRRRTQSERVRRIITGQAAWSRIGRVAAKVLRR
ncbi:MAG: metallophosphoesterase family protein [Chloroflexi bacterium]|nr:metallophosphoesterase family protein [Chloroflexota bacterium]